MLKKDNEMKWNVEAKRLFSDVKAGLTYAPVLISP